MQVAIEADQDSWLNAPQDMVRDVVTAADVCLHALNISKGQIGRSQAMRIGKIFCQLGWKHTRRQVKGVREHVYVRPGSEADQN
jgi:hypothetical protein